MAAQEDEQWLFTNEIPDEEHQSRTRFRRTVRKIVKLLAFRKIFSRAGSYLNTSMSRRPQNAHIRRVMTEIFTSWPTTILKGTKVIFDHLERRRGVLVYRHYLHKQRYTMIRTYILISRASTNNQHRTTIFRVHSTCVINHFCIQHFAALHFFASLHKPSILVQESNVLISQLPAHGRDIRIKA